MKEIRYNRRDKMTELIEKLTYAKNAVIWLVGHESGSVDFHGLSYWASEVERLRAEIKKLL
jgi:hypothetical protein